MDKATIAAQLKVEDPSKFELQKSALISLLKDPESVSVDILLHILNKFQNIALLELAINILAKMHEPEAIAVLVHAMFEQSQVELRGEAARALGFTRSERAIAPLKRLLQSAIATPEQFPVLEALWAVANLCQAEVLKVDAEWELLIKAWQAKGSEYAILAKHIQICWDGQTVIL